MLQRSQTIRVNELTEEKTKIRAVSGQGEQRD